jgi:hypothetical protein
MKIIISSERIDFGCLLFFNAQPQELDKYHPHPNIINDLRMTCLGYFCSNANIEMVRQCLQKGANPDLGHLWYEDYEINNVKTPLVIASGKGEKSFEIVQELIKYGATITDEIIQMMLYECVWNVNLKLLQWSFENSSKIDVNYKYSGASLFIILCMRWNIQRNQEQIECARLLIQKGSNLNTIYRLPGMNASSWKEHLNSSLFGLTKEEKLDIINKILTPV